MTPIIAAQSLLALMAQPHTILIDARTGPQAFEKYLANHIAGALYVDLETQLAHKEADASNGGRHPLPSPSAFGALLGTLGIDTNSHVVVYDDKQGANPAARFWWMLRATGHEKVQILDGGFDAALAAGISTSSGEEVAMIKPDYPVSAWLLPTANIMEVEKVAQNSEYLVIDVRDAMRFRGEKEPIDLIAGHIPGAVNIPFTQNLDEKGFFLSPEALREKYMKALGGRKPSQIIVHCGSGVTACHTLASIAHSGLPIPTLYVGSWSEWSRTGRTIGIGE